MDPQDFLSPIYSDSKLSGEGVEYSSSQPISKYSLKDFKNDKKKILGASSFHTTGTPSSLIDVNSKLRSIDTVRSYSNPTDTSNSLTNQNTFAGYSDFGIINQTRGMNDYGCANSLQKNYETTAGYMLSEFKYHDVVIPAYTTYGLNSRKIMKDKNKLKKMK